MYFVLNTWLIEYQKKLSKLTAKSFLKKTWQLSKTYISKWVCQNFSNEVLLYFSNDVLLNFSNDVLLAWFKFKAKTPSRSGVCTQGEWQKYTPPSPLLSKDEGLRDIGHSMSIENLILGVNSVTVSYLIHYHSLLQNATDIITKYDSYFITKCDRSLLQNASGFLLQIRQLLQIATISLQNATVITKCDYCYKLRQYTDYFHYFLFIEI